MLHLDSRVPQEPLSRSLSLIRVVTLSKYLARQAINNAISLKHAIMLQNGLSPC